MNGKFSDGGFHIPPLGGNRNLIKSSVGNELVRALNTLGNIQARMTEGLTEPRVIYSDGNLVIEIPKQDDDVTVDGVQVKRAIITAIGQDGVTVSLWNDGASDYSGSSVTVAKPPELRGSLTGETIWSTAWTYSYTGADYQERTRAATGLATTKQRVNAPYRVDDVLFVVDTNEATGVASASYIDLNVDGRAWWTETGGTDENGDPVYAFVARTEGEETRVSANEPDFNGGGSGGGGVQMYRLKSVQGDYLTCRTYDGTTEGGTDVFIAKNYKLRNSITSQVIDGVTVDYTYTTTVEREAEIGANTETQIIVPRYLADDLIFAIYSETTGVEKDAVELTLLDINADARAWAVKYVAP